MAISMEKMLLDEDTSFHPRWDEYEIEKYPLNWTVRIHQI
jgi:hypothetical protein